MKKVLLILALVSLASGGAVGALDFSLKDGSAISGEIQGQVTIKTSFGTLSLDGMTIKSIALGSPSRIELSDGNSLIGEILDSSLSVKWKYGVARLELAKIAAIGGAAASGSGTGSVSTSGVSGRAGAAATVGGVEFVAIPGGEFSMGDSAGGGQSDERPVHKVWVDGFRMGKYEVTLKQFKAFILDTSYRAQGQWKGDGEDYPVVNVSWEDANAYCTWFGRKYGVPA